MPWLRSTPCFVRVLVALFLVAQFAGVVSSPLASAHAAANTTASHVDHQHSHGQGREGSRHHHGDQSRDRADLCCALHAFFAGVLPSAVETADVVGERIAVILTDVGAGVDPGRLDRPPRPML